jgi:hypothetical protein
MRSGITQSLSCILIRTAEYYVSYQADSSWLCIRLASAALAEHLPDLHSSNSLVQVLLIDALQCEAFLGTKAFSDPGFGALLIQL